MDKTEKPNLYESMAVGDKKEKKNSLQTAYMQMKTIAIMDRFQFERKSL